MEREKIKELFLRYGYTIEEEQNKYIIFSLGTGMYPAIEIVSFQDIPQEITWKSENFMQKQDMLLRCVRKQPTLL